MSKFKQILLIGLVSLLNACSAISSAAAPKDIAPAELILSEPTPIVVSPFQGLTFTDGGTFYRVNNTGGADALASCGAEGVLSPDGTQLVVAQDGDIWRVNLADCATQNLTNTPDNFEINPQWWGSQGNKVVFGVDPEYSAGIPAAVNSDGSGYALIDERDTSTYRPALSPNAPYIAYLGGDGPIIKVLNEGVIPMDAAFYGMPEGAVQRMDSPAWSPDGTKIAWVATVATETWDMQVIVFDLANQSHTVVYSYTPLGRDGWPLAPVWSPDGQWLVFHAIAEHVTDSGEYLFDEFGYVVAKEDGTESHLLRPTDTSPTELLEQGGTPVWRADSGAVAFTYINAPETHYYSEAGVWTVNQLPVGASSFLLDW